MNKAYSMIELIFAILIIGILSSVILPNFFTTHQLAVDMSAKKTLTAVKIAVEIERYKRKSRGDLTRITSLHEGINVFDKFSPDAKGVEAGVMSPPLESCTNYGCWSFNGSKNISSDKGSTEYTYHDKNNYKCLFTIKNNRFVSINSCPSLGK